MKIIRWIINLLKRFFSFLFGKRKVTKRIKKNIRDVKNNHYLKNQKYNNGTVVPNSKPIYLLVNDTSRKETINRLVKFKNELLLIPDNNVAVNKIDKIINIVENSKISVYQNEKINEQLDVTLKIQDKKEEINKINETLDLINEYIEDVDKNIYDKVLKEYKEINYLTLTTLILDETYEEIRELKDDLKHHRYNKSYYNRVLERIKDRINNLSMINETEEIQREIREIRSDLYYKNKDKYDLLFNREVFDNVLFTCDELLEKVNKRVIDIKKDNILSKKETKENKQEMKKQEIKKEEIKKEKKEENKRDDAYFENIIKRFQDMELAYQIIFIRLNGKKNMDISDNIVDYLNNAYFDFLNDDRIIFNFDRNKKKVELVNLYNDMNYLNCVLTKQEFIPLNHINYPLLDLTNETITKKENVENLLAERFHYQVEKHEESTLVNNKLNIMLNEELKRKNEGIKVLKK